MRNRSRERSVLRVLAAAASMVLLAVAPGCGSKQKADDQPYPAPDGLLDPRAQTEALGKGVNFGNLLDANPAEGAWTNGRLIEEEDFDRAVDAGFDSVRLPVKFSGHSRALSPYTIEPAFMARVEEVVNWGLSKDLRMIVTLHHYDEIHQSPQGQRRRFVELWKQIATTFKDAPDGLYYELLNEPSNGLTVAVWNDVLVDALRAIREIDRHHTIVVGCTNWSNPAGLEGLVLPAEETNAIVTFHYYTPTLFVFQGKDWIGPDWATTGITWPGPPATPVTPAPGIAQWARDWIQAYNNIQDPDQNPGGEAFVRNEIAAAAAWGERNGRPLWMSEFTAQDGADLASRARWISFVRRELEGHGIPWSFWSLLSDGGSKLYDVGTGTWTTELTEALGLEVAD